jgi:hypothetical protein
MDTLRLPVTFAYSSERVKKSALDFSYSSNFDQQFRWVINPHFVRLHLGDFSTYLGVFFTVHTVHKKCATSPDFVPTYVEQHLRSRSRTFLHERLLQKDVWHMVCQIFLGTTSQYGKNIPNGHKNSKMATKIPNGHEIDQMVITYTNIFH